MSEPENDSTETYTIDNHKISVSFSRKMSDGNYGGTEATAWVQGDIPQGLNSAQKAEALANLFLSAKAAVLDELGIQWSCDDQGMVRETVTPYVSATQAAAAVHRVIGGSDETPRPGGGSGNLKVMNAGKPDASDEPLPQWLYDECAKLGITGVWDKRGTRRGQQPSFTEAIPRGATGHGKDGSAKGFWPPN